MNIAGSFHFDCEIELRIGVLHIVEPSKHCPNLRRFSLVFPHSMAHGLLLSNNFIHQMHCVEHICWAQGVEAKLLICHTCLTHTNMPLTSRCIYTFNTSTSRNDSANVMKNSVVFSWVHNTMRNCTLVNVNANPQCHVLLCTLGAFGLRPGVEWQVPQPTETGKLPVQRQ